MLGGPIGSRMVLPKKQAGRLLIIIVEHPSITLQGREAEQARHAGVDVAPAAEVIVELIADRQLALVASSAALAAGAPESQRQPV